MNRWLPCLFVCCGAALLASPEAYAQATINDKVYYIDHAPPAKPDPKKPAPPPPIYEGEITEEGPAGIKIKLRAGGTKDVPAADIRDIIFDSRITGFDKTKTKYNEAIAFELKYHAEEKGKADNLRNAIAAYEALLGKDLKSDKFTKAFLRQLDYKIASLKLMAASGNKAGQEEAMKGLIAFYKDNPGGWQASDCLVKIAEFQVAREDYKGAVKTIDDILNLKGLSEEVNNKYQMLSADALVKAGDVAGAEKRIEAILGKMKADDPQRFSLEMRRIKCKAGRPDQVTAAIAEVSKKIKDTPEDNKLQKAIAHNTLGDCLLMTKDRKGDAVYEFLLVEVWYPANEAELSKAYSELAKIYSNERKNEARAKEYQDKLDKLRSGK